MIRRRPFVEDATIAKVQGGERLMADHFGPNAPFSDCDAFVETEHLLTAADWLNLRVIARYSQTEWVRSYYNFPTRRYPSGNTLPVFGNSQRIESAILTAAKANKFIYPIIVTGICTAMRRGDCRQLLKTAVDLPNKFIKVKTSKTGELVQIPIFPLLQEMLEKLEPNDGPFVFPEQADVYVLNPDHITLQVRKVMRAAGFFDTKEAENDEERSKARGEIYQARANGLRKASVRDFHSFRVTGDAGAERGCAHSWTRARGDHFT